MAHLFFFSHNVCYPYLNKFQVLIYSITCIQGPLKVSNESGLLQQVVF